GDVPLEPAYMPGRPPLGRQALPGTPYRPTAARSKDWKPRGHLLFCSNTLVAIACCRRNRPLAAGIGHLRKSKDPTFRNTLGPASAGLFFLEPIHAPGIALLRRNVQKALIRASAPLAGGRGFSRPQHGARWSYCGRASGWGAAH